MVLGLFLGGLVGVLVMGVFNKQSYDKGYADGIRSDYNDCKTEE
jgi:hypothetical protein